MREILFRGKQVGDGEWIEGYVFPQVIDGGYAPLCITTEPICANDYSEILGDWAIVDSSTVGQYTGLTDKNGRKIFEGDIVVINTSEKRKIKKYRVEFDNGIFGIRLSTNANDNTIIPLRSFDYIEIIKGEEND